MNPLADLLDLPVWQFLLVYSSLAVFTGVFLAYLRWEACQVEASAAVVAEDVAELRRGPGQPPEVEARLVERGLVVSRASSRRVRAAIFGVTLAFVVLGGLRLARASEKGKPVGGLAVALGLTLAGGLVLAARPLWLTSRGAAALDGQS